VSRLGALVTTVHPTAEFLLLCIEKSYVWKLDHESDWP